MNVIDLRSRYNGTYGKRPLNWINGVVIHHDGIALPDFDEDAELIRIAADARYEINTHGWPGLAYHYMVAPSGRVYQTGDINTIRYHTYGPDDPNTPQRISIYNEHWVAICFLGNYSDSEPTEAAIASATQLIKEIKQELNMSLTLQGHRDVYNTECPGNTWNEWKGALEAMTMTQSDKDLINSNLNILRAWADEAKKTADARYVRVGGGNDVTDPYHERMAKELSDIATSIQEAVDRN